MKTVYHAANAIDAQLVLDWLADHGVEAYVQGAGLTGAAGALPMEGLVRVAVLEEDAVRARRIVAESPFASPAPPAPAALRVVAPAAVGAPSWRGKALAIALAGLALGYGLAYWQLRLPFETDRLDFDHDGIVDSSNQYRGDLLVRTLDDRNGDGRPDQIIDEPYGGQARLQLDDDFDGRFETHVQYRKNQVDALASDLDGDGFFEYRERFVDGVLTEATFNVPISDAVFKREHFRAGRLTDDDIDLDRNGSLETHRSYDRFGEITATRVDAGH